MSEETLSFAGKYQIKGLLGQGGTARVYLCHDDKLDRDVAVKEPIADRPGADKERVAARFMREARINGMLQHPGIVPVYELGLKEDGTHFYAMRPISGVTLHEAIASIHTESREETFRRRMEFLGSLIDIADALAYAHSQGIVHRDVKPGNILIGPFGETLLFDWGLAKHLDEHDHPDLFHTMGTRDADESDTIMTREGQVLGTPSYMAPEQINPRFGEVDAASDVYALGVILFILLTGEKPYRGNATEIMNQKDSDDPSPSPSLFASFLPPELVAICEKAMAKDRSVRFPDAAAMAKELKAFRDGRLVSVYAYSRAELFRRFIARNKAAIGATLAVILSVVIGAGLSLNFAVKARAAHKRAEQALVDVTTISDAVARVVIQAGERFNLFFSTLDTDLKSAARKLNRNPSAKEMTAILTELQTRHPNVDRFAIIEPNRAPLVAASASNEQLLPSDSKAFFDSWKADHMAVSRLFRTQSGATAFAITVLGETEDAPRLTAIIRVTQLPKAGLDFDPLSNPYQVWCMDTEGRIVYDEDPRQVGKNLFSDAQYANFPELLNLGERISKETEGLGHYRFALRQGEGKVVQKIAAWESITPIPGVTWKLVVTYPYTY